MTIVPAVLPSSRAELERKLRVLGRIPLVGAVQIDVVDGKFASPASWPYTAPHELEDMCARGSALQRFGHREYEIDLMCLDPLRAIASWLALGASRLTLHAESTPDLPRLIQSIRSQYGSDFSLGLAIGIASDLTLLESSVEHAAYVQCMGIARIGRQGQPFDERVYEKVRRLSARYPHLPLQVDGGVSLINGKKLLALGASRLVVGSAIAGAQNPAEAVAAFSALETPYGV